MLCVNGKPFLHERHDKNKRERERNLLERLYLLHGCKNVNKKKKALPFNFVDNIFTKRDYKKNKNYY